MTALKLIQPKQNLYAELSSTSAIQGTLIDFVYDFLSSRGITTLSEVTADTLRNYIRHVRKSFFQDKNRYSFYKGLLEALYYIHQNKRGCPLASSLNASYTYKKCACFLMASGIDDPAQISATTRVEYCIYLAMSVSTKVSEYSKQLDRLKLSTIIKQPLCRVPAYKSELLYLAYYPNYSVAKRFYYTARKEFLFFDFSLLASETMKRQIYKGLTSIISDMDKYSNHYVIQHMITPLHYLYSFCIDYHIDDIKKVTKPDTDAFLKYLDVHMDATNDSADQILHTMRKLLFLSDKCPDYQATAWFLDRFTLSKERINPTRPIEAFYFDDISDSDNRIIFQGYMKYLLSLSPKYALQTILQKYYHAKEFIQHIESNGNILHSLCSGDILSYLKYLDANEIQPSAYNKKLMDLKFLLLAVSSREKISLPDFPFDYYFKKDTPTHLDRSVSEADIDSILSVLGDFPEYLGLMFLILYSTGLRINEVCSLRQDAPYATGGSYWLTVYQYKMRSEKQIPIPEHLYKLLVRYISKSPSSEFIFPAIMDPSKPFNAGTFSAQIKRQLKMYGITSDINFRSHDYRHTIATDLHYTGTPISVTRAFLGHKNENMTKQYIDHLPGHIDGLQREYFKENKL